MVFRRFRVDVSMKITLTHIKNKIPCCKAEDLRLQSSLISDALSLSQFFSCSNMRFQKLPFLYLPATFDAIFPPLKNLKFINQIDFAISLSSIIICAEFSRKRLRSKGFTIQRKKRKSVEKRISHNFRVWPP